MLDLRAHKECVLPAIGAVSIGADDRLGEDLGILFRLGFCGNIFRLFHRNIHVLIDQCEEIVSIRLCGITQIDHRYLVAVAFRSNGAIVSSEVTLGIQREKTHSAGAGVLHIGVQEERRLAYARRADHQIAIGNPPLLPFSQENSSQSGFSPASHRACDFHRTRRSINADILLRVWAMRIKKFCLLGAQPHDAVVSCGCRFAVPAKFRGKINLPDKVIVYVNALGAMAAGFIRGVDNYLFHKLT